MISIISINNFIFFRNQIQGNYEQTSNNCNDHHHWTSETQNITVLFVFDVDCINFNRNNYLTIHKSIWIIYEYQSMKLNLITIYIVDLSSSLYPFCSKIVRIVIFLYWLIASNECLFMMNVKRDICWAYEVSFFMGMDNEWYERGKMYRLWY